MVVSGLAKAMRVTTGDAQCLLNGHAADSVAEALGVVTFQLQAWIDNGTRARSSIVSASMKRLRRILACC